jgi:predicted aminopeptidase
VRSRRLAARLLVALLAVSVLTAAGAWIHPRTRYVLVAASYQLELLWGRVPLETALARGAFSAEERERLGQVPRIRSFAREIGLAERGHYSTINPDWARTVHNVSACAPLRFEPVTWWFPIVGTVPYLGYFAADAAEAEATRLRARGLDVHVRPAGAWSTLGWFRDPLLPEMARWDEGRLANTLFHELTHATVWIPGSVAFNESLASFVGDVASLRYLEHHYGPDADIVARERARHADRQAFQRLMVDVYAELDAVYSSDAPDSRKLSEKARILESLPDRVDAGTFSEPDRWRRWMAEEPWNNARLVQFRVYNRSPEWFAVLLDRHGGDLPTFLGAVEQIAGRGGDPYAALAEAVGAPPE